MSKFPYFFLGLIYICTACTEVASTQSEPLTLAARKQTQVVALGKLVPQGEVIKLSVANAEDSRVNQILVKEGDYVETNQVIAILQGIDRRIRDLEEAEKAVDFYRARLAQIKAGDAKKAEIEAQKANISGLEAQLVHETAERKAAIASAQAQFRQAQLTYQRNQALRKEGAISQQELDLAKEQLDLRLATLTQREAHLKISTAISISFLLTLKILVVVLFPKYIFIKQMGSQVLPVLVLCILVMESGLTLKICDRQASKEKLLKKMLTK